MTKELKPVAWAHMVSGEIGSITYSKGVAGSWEATDVKATPLYAIHEGFALVPVDFVESALELAASVRDNADEQFLVAAADSLITAAQEDMK